MWVLPAGGARVEALTLADLRGRPPALIGEEVLVVENPSILQAAREHGADRPVVCVSGQPSAAARLVVAQLVDAGRTLLLHADFDLGGVSIIEQLLAVAGRHGPGRAFPHRMGAAEYEAAVHASTVLLATTRWPNPSWSAALGVAMRRHGMEVFEEHVLGDLGLG